MNTGNYIYSDNSISEVLDNSKTVKGVLCVMTDNPEHKLLIDLADASETLDWYDGKVYAEDKYMRLPTKHEQNEIYKQKCILNKSLIAAGGEPFKDGWYWSSSEYNYYHAWLQHFGNGYVSSYSKNDFTSYVRPVLALSI